MRGEAVRAKSRGSVTVVVKTAGGKTIAKHSKSSNNNSGKKKQQHQTTRSSSGGGGNSKKKKNESAEAARGPRGPPAGPVELGVIDVDGLFAVPTGGDEQAREYEFMMAMAIRDSLLDQGFAHIAPPVFRPVAAAAPSKSRTGAPSSSSSSLPDAWPNEPDKQADERACVVCIERGAHTVARPCMHVCLCVTCARAIMQDRSSFGGKCPMCRAQLTGVERVY